MKLPKNFTKLEEFSGKTLANIAAMKPAGSRLGAGTLQKYFACVRSFLSWCEDESYVDASPAKKIKIGAKPNLYDAREPFSKSQLKSLFDSPQYRGHISVASRAKPGKLVEKDGKFWIPLIGLFTGMRLGEIVQLMVSDIREDGLIYFDVNKNEGDQKTLKTKASQRAIPVHKDLTKMGFMVFVQTRQNKEPNGRLFPEIKPGKNGYPSHNFSKYFGRYLKQVGVKALAKFKELLFELSYTEFSWADVIKLGRVTRLDVAIDMINAPTSDLLMISHVPGKSHVYFGLGGNVETAYVGLKKPGKASEQKVYDKLQEETDKKIDPGYGGVFHTRVEITLRAANQKLSNLGSIKNLYKRVTVIHPGDPPEGEDPILWTLYLDSCRFRGIDNATALIPNATGKSFQAQLAKAGEPTWQPEKIWSRWAKALENTDLLS